MDLSLLSWLVRIRKVEEKIAWAVKEGLVVGPCHLGIGQEAIAVGVVSQLKNTDRVLGNHRSHAQYIALGGDIRELFSEILGRATGCSKGRGGSMHLVNREVGFYGSVPIVAGTIPIAVGLALAMQKKGDGDLVTVFFGDGATEEGVFHESLNFASLKKLPILFICENNRFSSHLEISQRQPSRLVYRFAVSHKIPFKKIDGNDFKKVVSATREMVKWTRAGKGPSFVEAETYRILGHVGAREDVLVGLGRDIDLPKWKKRDPILKFKRHLQKRGTLNERKFQQLSMKIEKEVDLFWAEALSDPFPSANRLLTGVYREGWR